MRETLTSQEWLIMEALWQNGKMFLADLTESLTARVRWNRATYQACLRNLVQKGFVSYVEHGRRRLYAPVICREEAMASESRSLLSRMTKSSTTTFVTNMIREGNLTKEDRDELKDLIDALDEEDTRP